MTIPEKNTTRQKVLEGLNKGLKQKEIAKELGISEARVSAIKSAIKLGVKKGVNLNVNFISASRIPQTKLKPSLLPLSLFLHRMYAEYNLCSPSPLADNSLLKIYNLNNNTQAIGKDHGQTYRFTTKSLIIEGIELIAYRQVNITLILEPTAKAYANAIAEKIANKHGIGIDLSSAQYKLTEIEQTEHGMTQRIEGTGLVPIHFDKHNSPDVWTDLSFGLRGIESNNLEHMQLITSFTNDLIDSHAWEYTKTMLVQLAENQQQITHSQEIAQNQINQLAEQLNIHAPYLNAWQIVAEAINDPIKRKRAARAIENLNQKKLKVD